MGYPYVPLVLKKRRYMITHIGFPLPFSLFTVIISYKLHTTMPSSKGIKIVPLNFLFVHDFFVHGPLFQQKPEYLSMTPSKLMGIICYPCYYREHHFLIHEFIVLIHISPENASLALKIRRRFFCRPLCRLTQGRLKQSNPTYNKRHEKVLFCPPTPLKLKGPDR